MVHGAGGPSRNRALDSLSASTRLWHAAGGWDKRRRGPWDRTERPNFTYGRHPAGALRWRRALRAVRQAPDGPRQGGLSVGETGHEGPAGPAVPRLPGGRSHVG